MIVGKNLGLELVQVVSRVELSFMIAPLVAVGCLDAFPCACIRQFSLNGSA